MKNFNSFFLVLLTLLISADCIHAQAWVKKKGERYSQISFSSIVGTSKYSKDGNHLDLARKVSDRTIQVYHEYGIGKKFMLTGALPVKFVGTGEEVLDRGFMGETLPSGSLVGIGNTRLSVIYGIQQDSSWVYSAQIGIGLPAIFEENDTGLRSGVDASGLAPSIHIGHGAKFFWTSFDLGMNFRGNDFSSQWFTKAQIGKDLSSKILLILGLEALQSLENGDAPDGDAIETGLYTNDLEYTAFSLKLGYRIDDQWMVLGTLGGGITGHDVTRAPAFSLALSREIEK